LERAALPIAPSSPCSIKAGVERKILPLSGTEYQLSKNNQFIVTWSTFRMTSTLTDFEVSDFKRCVDEVCSSAFLGSFTYF
jgi:hypothetical protein